RPGPWSQTYAWGCVAVALLSVATRIYLAWHRVLSGVVRQRRSTPIPISSEPRQLLAPGYPRFVGSLPGNQALRPVLTELELAIPRLPARLAGLRIAHLSDLHLSGRIGRGYLDTIVDR